jgi:hypothetical protein
MDEVWLQGRIPLLELRQRELKEPKASESAAATAEREARIADCREFDQRNRCGAK